MASNFRGRFAVTVFAMSHVSWNMPSGRVLAALAPIFVVLIGFVVYCLVDLIRAPAVRYLPKLVWALVIVAAGSPTGPILYLTLGKQRYANNIQRSDGTPGGHGHQQPA